MGYIKKDNKFVSYLIVLITLFVLFIVTIEQYESLQINLDQKSEFETKVDNKRDTLTKYNEIQKDIDGGDKKHSKYLVEITEDKLIDYIYSYVESSNTDESKIDIKNLSITKGNKNELGFNQTNLNLSINVSNEDTMKRILDFFVSPDSKYIFFIESFTYPNDQRTGSFSLELPLKIFYK